MPHVNPPDRPSSIVQFLTAARDQWRALIQRSHFLLVRKRRLQTTLSCVVALVVALATGAMVSSARTHRDQWATSAPVLVATRDIPVGRPVTSANARIVRLPPAATPADAIHGLVRGASVRVAVTARTPLTRSILQVSDSPVELPAGWRTVAMPVDVAMPRLRPGDSVDVVAGSEIVATGGIVTGTKPVTIAVPADVAAVVAAAARMGEISLIAGG